MKSIEEIINGFESLPELPVSEEMLGACLEGNLTPLESIALQPEFKTGEMSELINEVLDEDNELLDNISSIEPINEDIDSAFESVRRYSDFNKDVDNTGHIF